MACNHRPRHHQTCIPPSSCSSCCSSSSFYQTQCPCSSSHAPLSDPLLQAMASRVMYSSVTPHGAHELNYHHQLQHQPHRYGKQHRFHQQDAHEDHCSAVSFLLSRIEAMESSLHKLTYSSSFRCSSGSLRHAAARTIQIHFRAFLVRRSRTLSQLKEIALVKSTFSSIKASLFNGSRDHYEALSLKIMDLLLILDSIQGSDPMVRDSKALVSRGLIQFLDLVDSRREKIFSKAKRNSRLGQNIRKSKVMGSKQGSWEVDQKETVDNLRSRIEKVRELSRICDNEEEDAELEGFNHCSDEDDEEYCRNIVENGDQIRNMLGKRHGFKAQPKVKMGVRFAEDENLSTHKKGINRPAPIPDGSSLDESDSSDDHVKLVDNLCNKVEEIQVFSPEVEAEDDEKARNDISGFKNTERNVAKGGNDKIRRQLKGSSEGFLFSAPLPVTMEDKAELLKKRKALKMIS